MIEMFFNRKAEEKRILLPVDTSSSLLSTVLCDNSWHGRGHVILQSINLLLMCSKY